MDKRLRDSLKLFAKLPMLQQGLLWFICFKLSVFLLINVFNVYIPYLNLFFEFFLSLIIFSLFIMLYYQFIYPKFFN